MTKVEKRAPPGRLRQIKVEKVSLVDRGAAIGARITLFKHLGTVLKEDTRPGGATMDLTQVMAKLSDEEKKVVSDAIAAAAKPMEKKEEPPKPEDVMKTLPAAVRAEIEKQQKALEEQAALEKKRSEEQRVELEKQRDEIAKMKEQTLDREYLAKAAPLKHVPELTQKELSDAMKCLEHGRPIEKALGEKVVKSFHATERLVAASKLLKEDGSSQRGADGSAKAEVYALAKKRCDENPKLDFTVALAEVASTNKDLYARYRAEEQS